MHGAVGAGRRRRRSWVQGHALPAVIQAAGGRGAARPRPEDTRSPDSPPTVLRALGCVPRAGAAPDLELACWPPASMTLRARAREAHERRPLSHVAPVRIRSACSRQTVQHATTRCRGQPCRKRRHPRGSCTARSFCPLLSIPGRTPFSTAAAAHTSHCARTRHPCPPGVLRARPSGTSAAGGLDYRVQNMALHPAAPMSLPSADCPMHSTRAQDAYGTAHRDFDEVRVRAWV